jgi:large subunit ribosomal protein L3
MRSGVIARKVGMTRVFDDNGLHVPVTVLKLDNVQVVAVRGKEKDGYTALQLGAGLAKAKKHDQAYAWSFRQGQCASKVKTCGIPG